MPPPDLAGSVALVTGASSGIGAATARGLAGRGAAVVLAARGTDALERVTEQIRADGGRAAVVALDVADDASCRAAVDATIAEFGRLDVLVNAAGLMLLARVEDADVTEWRRMVEVNLLGLMVMTHAALPHLLVSRGTVVQMSSAAGRVARPATSAYNATKWAVGAFSDALRQEVSDRGVRVVVMEPGSTSTPLSSHISHDATREAVQKRAASIVQLTPEDVAEAIVYAVCRPPHISFNEVLVRPTQQSW